MPPTLGTDGQPQTAQPPVAPQTFVPPQVQPVTPPPPTPPQTPQETLVPPPSGKPNRTKLFIIGGAILLLIIAVSVLAAKGMLPFGNKPLNSDTLLTDIASGMTKIKNAGYTVQIDVQSKQRDADAKPFKLEVEEDAELQAKIQRDADRFRDLQTIRQAISTYQYSSAIRKTTYPATLKEANVSQLVDPNGSAYEYSVSEDKKDFALKMTFETTKAIEAVKRYDGDITISGNTVTFTKDAYAYIYFDERQSQPFLVEVLNAQNELGYIPSDFKATLKATGAAEQDGEKANGRLAVTADVSMGDFTIAFDAEGRKIGENAYIIANKFPSFFGDLSAIKGKWIKLTPEDFSLFGYGSDLNEIQSLQSEIKEQKEKISEQVKLFLSIADKHHAIEVKGNPTRDSVNGQTAYRYNLTLNKNNIVAFYKDVTAEFPKRYGNDSFISADPETLDFLQSKSADQVFDYINKNTTLSIWANGDGIPVKFLLSIRMIPNVTTGPAAQKQINLDVAVTLNDINKKQKIDVPQDSISAEEVYMMFTGKTKEEVQAERQEQAVSKIRGALGTYSSLSGGTYPATLEDLKKKGSEIIPLNTNNNENYYGEYYKNKKILEVVPNDVVTKQPFMYSASGKTYKLTYTIDLAPYKKGTQMYGLYQTDYTSGNTYKIYLKYINGINTATEKALSEEALAAAKLDSDGDKVTNALEDYLGTNKNKADTDGDRTSDYDEITRGSDPLGPGYLESSYRGDFF